jgi:putative phage-type endonuclease
VEPEDLSDNEWIYWGTKLEQLVADRFCEVTGKSVRRRGLLKSDRKPFMLASVDRVVVGENAGLECKTANSYASKEWEGDNVPDTYYAQCQHYMAVTGMDNGTSPSFLAGTILSGKKSPATRATSKRSKHARRNSGTTSQT